MRSRPCRGSRRAEAARRPERVRRAAPARAGEWSCRRATARARPYRGPLGAPSGALLLEPPRDALAPSRVFERSVQVLPRSGSWALPEGDPGVGAHQQRRTAVGREPEAEPVATVRARVASLSEHLGERLLTDDRACEERAPERRHVRSGRIGASVAAATNGEMEDVRPPRAVDLHIAERRATRQLVRTEERRVAHLRRSAHEVVDEVVEWHPGRALGDQGENDVTAVAVGEALSGWELLCVPVESVEIVLGRRRAAAPESASGTPRGPGRAPRRGSRRSPIGARAGARP